MGAKKNKVRGRIGFINRTSYKDFIMQYPSSGVTYKDYIAVLKESTISIRDFILSHELGFKLPLNLGYIAVDKFKPSKRSVAIDWINTRKFGKVIPLLNFHSLGYVYKIKLYKNTKIKPLQVYQMASHRIIKRMLANNIKNTKKDYLSIDRTYFSKRFHIENYLTKTKNF